MPLYEYDCRSCGKRSETLAPAPPESFRCPECGSTRTQKAFSVFAASTAGREEAPPACGRGACPRCADD